MIAQHSMTGRKYFPEELPALAADLDSYLKWLGDEVVGLPGFKALLLGGGYGRGEGGIWIGEGAARLYNDLEFYLFAENVGADLLEKWIREGEGRLHIEIEIKVLPAAAFERARPSMFYYDLLNACIVVAGDEAWIRSLPPALRSSAAIPPLEAARLLVNRGMSLLRCLRWADGGMELPAGFCDRITSKLKLALADAVLCSLGRYHWSCRERNRLLADVADFPPDWEQLMKWHAEGVAFKFHPRHSGQAPADWQQPLGDLRAAWLRTFLWVESRRLGTGFASPQDYGNFAGRIFPEESPASNFLRQARDLARSGRVAWTGSDHPRSAVWKSLALLLDPDRTETSIEAAARLLRSPGGAAAEVEERCREAWKNYP
ncbi:MAG: hypothetical protein NTV93_04390 [Verrucomicrobia bacterium]|nr:hypothetical protein [Verrucomicrobiota bacterium]